MKLYAAIALMGLTILTAFVPMQTEPWTADQLLQPAELVAEMKRVDVNKPLIISVGPGAVIKGSVDVGPANKPENMKKLEQLVAHTRKDAPIVVYCGCCPFEHCPNVRPAFTYLTAQGFTHHKLLNLSHNIRQDWIDKQYPIEQKTK